MFGSKLSFGLLPAPASNSWWQFGIEILKKKSNEVKFGSASGRFLLSSLKFKEEDIHSSLSATIWNYNGTEQVVLMVLEFWLSQQPHTHLIVIWVLGNRLTLTMAVASYSHINTVCGLLCCPTSKVNEAAGKDRPQVVLVSCLHFTPLSSSHLGLVCNRAKPCWPPVPVSLPGSSYLPVISNDGHRSRHSCSQTWFYVF